MNTTTCIILSWNTYETVKESVERLLEENIPVILVENGSTDETKTWIEFMKIAEKVTVLNLPENVGNCVSRNLAIDMVDTKYYFLLDGDIIYVPNTIKVLEKTFKRLPNAGILGVHNPNQVGKTGHNGTKLYEEAEFEAQLPNKAYFDLPMAWTQYGLFLKTDQRFIVEPPFDRIGMGWEDNYFYWQMKTEHNLESYFITNPMYYHEAHSGQIEINKLGIENYEEERKRIFINKFKNSFYNADIKEISIY